MLKSLSAITNYLLFWLTFVGLCGVITYAYVKNDAATLNLVPMIIGIYASASFGKTVSAHVNARLDPDADVEEVIKSSNEK